VTDLRALQRLELALGVLGMTVVALVVVVAFDVIHYHGLAFEPHLAFAALDAVVVGRAIASLARQLRARRAFLRRLPVLRTAVVQGHHVRVVPGRSLTAFCTGLRRPAVYVSEGTLATSEPELRAILAHEDHHCMRRDPLRLLLARTVSDALKPLPPFAALAEREAALADLAADAAAEDALGDRKPLASAFARFEAVAPERVDRLVRTGPAQTIPSALLAAAAVTLAGIAALLAPMLFANWHPSLVLPRFSEPLALLLVCMPACLAAARAGSCLRPELVGPPA
jgi:hypothetical protein